MRVISGKARGTKLATIEGNNTRPTTDRVKESLFNLIQFDVIDAKVIDLFAGSGALGIEAASRGAKAVTLVENYRKCHEAIEYNIDRTGLENVKLLKSDVLSSFSRLEKADLILMDPPYSQDFILPVLKKISEHNLLDAKGKIVIEHSKDDKLPVSYEGFVLLKQKKYGISMVSIFVHE
ncbi:16S rRNA (guanine(966)-N(2))-methyltransferase RsmD [Acidaminobacter sp. JC074]|uniref:16S rRNA (guanine(966)-N(2))-methyltransferase RsmD n=1 Tax=Acidaminobacter sp. JC074 TaxID=2530199 RepID=UPI001F0E6B45|nr:16S rRNA (guanine(966)-N(2))-methyltransferase RsmD [Acidaminobacter sp. JC074]MCH4890271.1 16S rRNA (guanine(966)-N(2))-methyltransferase RsmD [Acidaminobacter sp. JC074]